METHLLLRGEGSGRLRDRLPAFKRRSDAIAYGSSCQKAAALVDLAEDGIGLPEEILDDEASFAEAAKLYFFFIRFDVIWSLNYFALLLLNFLEKPLWCSQNLAISCDDREYYFLGQLPYLSGAGSLIYEGVTLVILMAHMFFPISYEGFKLYWKSHLNKLKILFLLVLLADFFVYVLYLSPVAFYSLPFRIAPYVRVVFFILNIRDLRETLVVLAGMVATYVNVLLLGLLFLLFSSWLAYVIFEDTEQGTALFTSYGATTYHMFILFTTSNNPDVWIPAYKASRCSGQNFWQQLEFVFGWLYFLEMALKVYSYGFENYWKDGQNRFDFIITVVIVVVETATFVSPKGLPFLSNGEWIRYLLIVRMLRLIRLLTFVRRYRAFVATFLTLIPSLMPYLGTIFCVLCMYCSLGVQIFGGLVNSGNPQLAETDLADNDYLLFNFNDYPSGMITLFNLLVMGNWQAWMQSYKELTSAWSYIYFVSFYLVTILLLLNLVVAFVLEAFFAEMEIEDAEKCGDKDDEGEGKESRRRSAGTKTRSQRVEQLLHHMLSSELDQHAQCADA
ncbi:hypothetical protein AgCh_003724 [Apium graveolens]